MTTPTTLRTAVTTMAAVSTLLLGWGMSADRHRPNTAVNASEPAPIAASTPTPIPEAALMQLQQAFTAYDRIRDHLAKDQLTGIADDAKSLSAALTAATAALPTNHSAAPIIAMALDQATHLSAATTVEDARDHFAHLSQALVSIAEGEPRLQTGRFIFSCPMTKGYKKWVQGTASKANPYMGTMMSTCGSTTTWVADDRATVTPLMSAAAAKDIAFFTCSMHPAVKMHVPGKCPICSMDLIPVTNEQVASGEIMIDETRRQLIGVRTAAIAKQPMMIPIHASGHVTYDETGFTDVSLKYGGWVTLLTADTTGMSIEKGQPLFTLYSPELYAAEQEYVLMLHAHATAPTGTDGTLTAAKERLHLWDLSDSDIAAVGEKGAQTTQVIHAPSAGYLIAKDVVQGSAVMPGQRLLRIAPIDRVWVLAEIFETDVAVVHAGQPVTVSLTYLPGVTATGTIDYLYPYLTADTRSVRARIVLDNPTHQLRPDMYATVSIGVDAGERLQVPKSAVVYTGTRRLIFVDMGGGRLRPHQVTLGLANDQFYEVLSGLKPGDRVVTSGNFLVAAESRIRSAELYWGDDHDAK